MLFIYYKIKMKKTFVFYSDRIDYTQEMTDTEKGQFLDLILKYQNGIEVNPQGGMKFIRSRIKKQLDEDNQKRNEIIQKRSEAGKKHTGNQYTTKDNRRKAQKNTVEQMEQNGTNGTVNVNDNVNDNVNVNDNEIINQTEFDEISNEISDFTQKQMKTDENRGKQITIKNELGIEEKEKNSAKKEKEYGNSEINGLIEEIKETCDEMGLAYDHNEERNFAKHILTAKAFGIMSDKLGQTRTEFAKNILIASVKIGFWKGPCAGPKKIYQNFAEVFNDTIKQKNKNSIPQF